MKCNDVNGNHFEWLLYERMLYKSPHLIVRYNILLGEAFQVKAIEFHRILKRSLIMMTQDMWVDATVDFEGHF